MFSPKHINNFQNESGSALVYILIAIALLAALTVTFLEPSGQQASSQNIVKTITGIRTQADFIRSAIQECVLSYPQGDDTIDISGGGTDEGARQNYPIQPNSSHFDVDDRASDILARNLKCPGRQDGPDVNDHARLFGGTSGKFMPPPPDLFENWEYYNGNDGIFIWTHTTKTDAFITTALTKLDDEFSECEADVIVGGGSVHLDSDDTIDCLANTVCFRIRMITNSDAVWEGDSDGDEAGCP